MQQNEIDLIIIRSNKYDDDSESIWKAWPTDWLGSNLKSKRKQRLLIAVTFLKK